MKTRNFLVTVVFILSTLAPAGQAVSGPPQPPAPVEPLRERTGASIASPQGVPFMPGREVVLRRDNRYNPYHVAPPERAAWSIQSANFSVNWNPSSCTGSISAWSQPAKDAFSYAVGIWASQLNASTTIVVDACWRSDLPPDVLGSAGPTAIYQNVTAGVWYPVALANALANSDLNGATAEIKANFSSTFDWYFGTDGNPGMKMDFVSVVLHELSHGLGFIGSMWVDVAGYTLYCGGLGQGCWGYGNNPPYNPMIYDRFAENSSPQSLLNESLFHNPSVALGAQLTSGGVYFNGANAKAANGGSHVKLYAPSPWEPGSSYAHLDTIFDNTSNALMTPSLADGEAIHNPGPITLGIFKDIGWPAGAAAATLTSITPTSGNDNGTVHITNLAGSNFQAGATVKLTRSGQSDINATNVVVVSSSQITCDFDLTGAAAGQWNVVVTNPDSQSGTLPNGFTVSFSGKTWNGSISSDWHIAGNWTPSGVPTSTDDVVIPNVARAPVISSGDAAANGLTINTGAVLDLTSRKLTVEGTLTNNGTLKQTQSVAGSSPTNFLRVTNLAGTLTKYYGVDITASGAANVTADQVKPLQPEANVIVTVSGNQFCAGRTMGVKRCFDIAPAAALAATVRFYLSEAERNGQVLDNLMVLHYGGSWTEEPGPYIRGGAGDAQYVQVQNINDFSPFALAGPGSSIYLPIVMKRWPPIPDTPTLNAISNPSGSVGYTVSWNAAYLADTYTLQEATDAAFSSPVVVYGPGSGLSWSATGKAAGTYYYRVKASNSYGDSGWSNVQSVQVVLLATVYVQNNTGGQLCYEVYGSGIGQKCYSSGLNYYGAFPVGTYSWHVSACGGSADGTQYYSGTKTHTFWCGAVTSLQSMSLR